MQWDCDFLTVVWAYCIENSESDSCKDERNDPSYLTSESERAYASVSLVTEAPPIEAYYPRGKS